MTLSSPPAFNKLVLDASIPSPLTGDSPRSRACSDAFFEETSPVFDKNGLPPGFPNEKMLKMFRKMKRLFAPEKGNGITLYSNPESKQLPHVPSLSTPVPEVASPWDRGSVMALSIEELSQDASPSLERRNVELPSSNCSNQSHSDITVVEGNRPHFD